MSLRWKFALITAALATGAALAASAVGYVAVRDQLVSQVDDSIAGRAGRLAQVLGGERGGPPPLGVPDRVGPPPPGAFPGGGPGGQGADGADGGRGSDGERGDRLFLVQTISSTGEVNAVSGVRLPVDAEDRGLARGGGPPEPRLREADLDGGTPIRMVTVPVRGGGAAQVARSTAEVDETLSRLRVEMLLIAFAVIALSTLFGLVASRRATASLEQLTVNAEEVAATGTPDTEITVDGRDEIGRLGRALSQMLASLARSRAQQQRLVQDAGHELRTPLTSLRTNIAVLDRFELLDPAARAALIADLRSETGEMASLVDELVELTVGGEEETPNRVDLDRLATRAAERAERRSGRVMTVEGRGTVIEGRPRSLERAVSNLLDNAAKFDTSGGPIELRVLPDRIEVADRGPGIPEDQLELVFERFHRTAEARNVPGSGLGLAIVRQVAELHGGNAYARERDGGGAIVGFTFGAGAPRP